MLCGHPVEDVINSPLRRGFRSDIHTHTHTHTPPTLWLIHVDVRLIHIDVWQKPTQYFKAIGLQLKKIGKKLVLILKLMMLHMDQNYKTDIHITELSRMNRRDTQTAKE